jgi:AraC-like DNA-binding protein
MWVHNEIVKNIARSCAAYGIKEQEVYREAGVDEAGLKDENGRQDWKAGVSIWRAALKLTGYRFIGLSFGKNINFGVLGWIAPVTTSSPSLKHAWKSFADFFPLMGDMMAYYVAEQADGAVKVIYEPNPAWVQANPLTAALAVEHAMSLTLSISSYLAGRMIRPVSAGFTCNATASERSIYKETFGTVVFNQPQNSILFDAATANTAVVSFNRMIYEQMQELCTTKLRELQTQETYTARVIKVLNQKQSYYSPKLNEVAAMLNISPRTLQRKLQEENTSYQDILESHQIEIASQLLRQPHTQIKEVAFALGFNNAQSFSRAFKRKLGMSPTEMKGG